jgi:hypothetical protein
LIEIGPIRSISSLHDVTVHVQEQCLLDDIGWFPTIAASNQKFNAYFSSNLIRSKIPRDPPELNKVTRWRGSCTLFKSNQDTAYLRKRVPSYAFPSLQPSLHLPLQATGHMLSSPGTALPNPLHFNPSHSVHHHHHHHHHVQVIWRSRRRAQSPFLGFPGTWDVRKMCARC